MNCENEIFASRNYKHNFFCHYHIDGSMQKTLLSCALTPWSLGDLDEILDDQFSN